MVVGDLVFYIRAEDNVKYASKILGFAPGGKVKIVALVNDNGRLFVRHMSVNDRMLSHRKYLPDMDDVMAEIMAKGEAA